MVQPSGTMQSAFNNNIVPRTPGGTVSDGGSGMCSAAVTIWLKRSLQDGFPFPNPASLADQMQVAQVWFEKLPGYPAKMGDPLEAVFLQLLPHGVVNTHSTVNFANNDVNLQIKFMQITASPGAYYLAMHMEE